MCICGPSGGSDEAGRLWGPPGEHGSKSPVSDTFWPTSATATGTGPSGDWLSTTAPPFCSSGDRIGLQKSARGPSGDWMLATGPPGDWISVTGISGERD